MRIGLLGGTFDPIHSGHLRAAELALGALDLDRVAFVPAGMPPHRPRPAASLWDRFAMCCLATAGQRSFVAEDWEVRREGPSYTVETVEAFHREHPGHEVVVIVGSDNLKEMPSWRRAQELFSLCRVAFVVRPGEPSFEGLPAGVGVRVEGDTLQVSATEIRRRVAAGESVSDVVPPWVSEYIEKRGLYR